MPIKKDPISAKCFYCKKDFLIKFVPPRKAYSRKNDWDYWTEKESEVGKKICDGCLRNLYKNYKKEFKDSITNPKLRQLLRNYLSNKYYQDTSKNLFKN